MMIYNCQFLGLRKEWIATTLIYIIAPVVIFYWTYSAELTTKNLSIPFIFFTLASIIWITFFYIGWFFYKNDSTRNILAFTSWTGNTGYFGLPVILSLLWEEYFSISVLAILWFVLYENTIWFYLTAKGNFSTKESFKKVLTLPTVYAFVLWIIVNKSWIDLDNEIILLFENFKWTYSILWIMIIWLWLNWVRFSKPDNTFLWLTFFGKFIIWPTVVWLLIYIDKCYFNYYSEPIYNVFLIMAIVPLASNTVALATELQAQPEKAILAVLYSTLFALIYIPVIVSSFL